MRLHRVLLQLFICLFAFIGIAHAQATYEVTGVAANDVLNIRLAPRASAPKVGSYGPRESGIIVHRRRGGWALTGRGGSKPDGWVNARFLKRTFAPAQLRLPLQCLGTEPFWSITIRSPSRATYSDPEVASRPYAVSQFRRIGRGATMRLGADGQIAITAARCSDGMSDNIYPYTARVRLPGGRSLAGCCR